MTTKTSLLSLLLVSGSVSLAATQCTVHSTASWPNDAQLIWSESKSYLLIASSKLGWRRSLPRLVGDTVGDGLGLRMGIPPATDTFRTQSIVTIAGGHIDVQRVSVRQFGLHYVLDGQIYTQEEGIGLVRWTGSEFARATDGERARFDQAHHLDVNFSDRDGWSGRSNVLSQPYGASEFVVHVGGIEWKIIAQNHWFPDRWQAIDIQKAGERPQRVWSVQMDYKSSVSEEEYRKFLNP